MKPTRIRAALVSAALATVLTAVGGGTAQARQSWDEAAVPAAASGGTPTTGRNSCLSTDGTDLNALLTVREQIIGPPACRVAVARKPWVRSFPSWGTAADAASAVYPADYVPSVPKPQDDFILKFLGVRIVQDIGTPHERSFTFGPEVLQLVVPFEGLPFATFASPALPGLKSGTHTTTVFMRLSSEHCDGLGTDREENCLPAGEFPYTGDTPFEVVKRHA
ncbi:hypothetical protein [Streptomyces sp. NPDC090022]|uniref:hypothetical protein n=1 Tax=Streptomyces sp. NPDC090022 TaxID=3365920 RepID=UPI0038025A7E